MNLIEQISADFITAFKAKEKDKKTLLGLVKSDAVKYDKNPSDEEVVKILKKFENSLTTTIDTLPEVVEGWSERDEIKIIQAYLPEQMSESDIEAKVSELISGGADNIGKIMGAFKSLDADNSIVSKIARKLL